MPCIYLKISQILKWSFFSEFVLVIAFGNNPNTTEESTDSNLLNFMNGFRIMLGSFVGNTIFSNG